MKHRALTAIAHNLADSLGCGMGLMIGLYETDVFGEAAASSEGFIEIDFLTGETSGGEPSASLAAGIAAYVAALPAFCERNGAAITDFVRLTARYSGRFPHQTTVVEIEDAGGKVCIDRYIGVSAARPRAQDSLGRIRRVRTS